MHYAFTVNLYLGNKMKSKLSLNHKSEIERDLKAIGYYSGIFILNILVHKLSSEIKYSFFGFGSSQDAIKTTKWAYTSGGFDEVCLHMVEPLLNQKGDYFVQRWLVRVNSTGNLMDELLVVIEDFASDPVAKVMI